MNNFFGSTPLSAEELQRQVAMQRRDRKNLARNNSMAGTANQGDVQSADVAMSGGDSLDEIIRQNNSELQRRRSIPQPYNDPMMQDGSDRRMSMMDYGNPQDPYADFQFGDMSAAGDAMTAAYGGMPTGMAMMPGHSGPYSQPNLMAMSNGDFTTLSPDVMGNMMAFSNLNMGSMAMTADPNSLGLYSPTMGNQYAGGGLDPVNTDFAMDLSVENTPLSAPNNAALGTGLDGDDEIMSVEPVGSNTPRTRPGLSIDPNLGSFQRKVPPSISREVSGSTNFQSPTSGTSRTVSQMSLGQTSAAGPAPGVATPATSAPTPNQEEKGDKTVYSKSGFDMLRALWYVATRKNPTIQLGAVDMSCAFVVCDVTQNDCPIIYVSDNFQNLTGYSRHEIAGKNCRFLQSPDGIVEAGSKREFVENDAVFKLKNTIARGEEIQQSLINYRKGGKPFLNLLTMVPIPWDNPDEIRFFIGFQIDLVECPDAITGTEGGVQVDYQHSQIGPYIWTPPSAYKREQEDGQTLGIDDVSTLLKQLTPKGAASDWHKQSWDKMLLENTDDVIHVLSLKGVFLYLSPSCRKVLEYDSNELMTTSLSEICHPSDIVPVTRELKEAQGENAVNIVFRIRRKNSGYMWFESHGSLFSDQGKGRKCIILVGRRRPVFVLPRSDLEANGGIGDSEIWTKVSTSGMFLFVSSSVRSLLDLQPSELVGTSMQNLMRKESRLEFGRTIERARKGKIAGCKHEIQNKRGQVLQAYTTFYPADVAEGQKLAFVLAQTKLLKTSSRTISPVTGAAAGSAKPGGALTSNDHSPPNGSTTDLTSRSNSGAGIISPTGGAPQSLMQEAALAIDDNIFDELKTTRCTSWQYELRQMEKVNRLLAEELAQLLSNKKKRKRRKGGSMVRDCANCHTRNTPEWRRGPSGNRDLCNSCGLRWAKQTGRVSPRNSSRGGNGDSQSKKSNSPIHSSPLQREMPNDTPPLDPPSRSSTAAPSSTAATNDVNSPATVTGGTTVSGGAAAAMTAINKMGGHVNPPPSRPMLEGGSGLGGGGMQMTLIREERETSA
ncbi:PAS domain-containing protein [Apodospora peruviana]|uniref:PAS domain-containing protein n=1 Tax=Apodospora peruviana TaxID=516989 RepID=A0AAE0M028_9PEZI|nr:PAS domain-containing protein [Apodospora peruviana]